MILEFTFWVLIVFTLYAYVGYPLVLKILSVFSDKAVIRGHDCPRVSLIISAYNEEKWIREKLENSISLDYPRENLEIIVVSDASTDGMEDIARTYESVGVRTLRIEGRLGKAMCLNHVVPAATGEILVFSDANSLYQPAAIKNLVRNFADPTIGFVTGHTKYRDVDDSSGSYETVSLYSRVELVTKRLESRLGACVGADGAIFAIRKGLYRPLRSEDINDFVIPLNIIGQGFRGILEEAAYCIEESASGKKGEYLRQVRISNRTLRALFAYRHLFNVFKFGLLSVELFSHKMAKYLVPFALLGILIVNAFLLGDGVLYRGVFAGQLLFYGTALLGSILKETKFPLRGLLQFSRSFTSANLAILKGWFTLVQGEKFITWQKAR